MTLITDGYLAAAIIDAIVRVMECCPLSTKHNITRARISRNLNNYKLVQN